MEIAGPLAIKVIIDSVGPCVEFLLSFRVHKSLER